MNENASVLAVIDRLKPVPIIWDRFTENDDGLFVVYGWIARSDRQRDFVMFEQWRDYAVEECFCVTSSAKYSREITRLLYGSDEDHSDCIPIAQLLTQPAPGA